MMNAARVPAPCVHVQSRLGVGRVFVADCTRGSRRLGFHAGDGAASRGAFHPAKEVPMKRLIALLLLACFSTGTLTACNTMAGAGKDVQKVGEKVEQKAEDCKDAHC
jgi:predicted small secreted protein